VDLLLCGSTAQVSAKSRELPVGISSNLSQRVREHKERQIACVDAMRGFAVKEVGLPLGLTTLSLKRVREPATGCLCGSTYVVPE